MLVLIWEREKSIYGSKWIFLSFSLALNPIRLFPLEGKVSLVSISKNLVDKVFDLHNLDRFRINADGSKVMGLTGMNGLYILTLISTLVKSLYRYVVRGLQNYHIQRDLDSFDLFFTQLPVQQENGA